MKKKQLLFLTPMFIIASALVGCKSGGGDTPSGEDVLEELTASTKASNYWVGDSFDKSELNVFATYSKSGLKTLTKDQYSVAETLPYTFTENDVTNGKTFNISFSGKTAQAVATVQEDIYKKIDWNTTKVYNNKTLYELAKDSDDIVFGKKSSYLDQIKEFKSFNVDEGNKGYIKGYLPSNVPETVTLYILLESDSHVIQFDENDRIKVGSDNYGPFCNLTKTKTINITKKKMKLELNNDLSYFFKGSSALTDVTIPLPTFDTSIVTKMASMFEGCSSLKRLDLSAFSTDKVIVYDSMFNGCSQLETIYVSKYFQVGSSATSSNMFKDCNQLKGGNGTTYNDNQTDGKYAHIDAEGNPGYFTESKN